MNNMLYYIILCYIIILYVFILYYIILYHIILYIILYHTILYQIIIYIYNVISYYIILYCIPIESQSNWTFYSLRGPFWLNILRNLSCWMITTIITTINPTHPDRVNPPNKIATIHWHSFTQFNQLHQYIRLFCGTCPSSSVIQFCLLDVWLSITLQCGAP